MAIVSIKKALERHLATVTPALATAYENVAFTPTAGIPYQRVVVITEKTVNPLLGSDYYREEGTLQVFLAYPTNAGSNAALARAELIQQKFKRGTTLIEGNVQINFFKTPTIQGSLMTNDRLIVPISIPYEAEVLSL